MPAQLVKCIDFSTFPVGPGKNPLQLQDVVLTVHNNTGGILPSSNISTPGAFHGLDCSLMLEVVFQKKVSAVCAHLVTFAQPARVDCFDPAGTNVGTVVMAPTTKVAQSIVCASPAIRRIVVRPPNNETFLLSFCFG